jgi:hypothetical protein
MALGLPPEAREMEQIQWWRNYFKNAPSMPTKPSTAARCSTTCSKQGRRYPEDPDAVLARARRRPYIGTACLVAMKDPIPAGSTTAPIACSRTSRMSRR